ncbi:MAG: DUF721 domain-containing protein [Flavobacteriales bacterium]|jgi:hypothetical protein|nr:DUF721 domain-containing protein [Flavobacteriales bacterium]
MRGKHTHNVGDIIRKLMKNPKLSEKLDELDALAIWDDLIGEALTKYVVDQKIYKGTLYVKLKSAPMRNELSYKKTELKQQINKRLGKPFLKDIVLK